MSLRPRYSLLTLLVLTALVAGGVKLWYGPHHVVEEREPGKQLEYNYTRSWNGEKIVHGPCIIRLVEPDGPSLMIAVSYVLHDQKLSHFYLLTKQSQDLPQLDPLAVADYELLKKMPISASEQLVFRQAIDRELNRTALDPGKGVEWFELIGNADDPGEKIHTFRDIESYYHETLSKPWNSFTWSVK